MISPPSASFPVMLYCYIYWPFERCIRLPQHARLVNLPTSKMFLLWWELSVPKEIRDRIQGRVVYVRR